MKDLPPDEYEKFSNKETKEFIAKKSLELFPPLEGTEEFHINKFKKDGWIQDQGTVYGREFIPGWDD